jgi:alkylation response protein AidB-like acyl-CoA dehydrogenase
MERICIQVVKVGGCRMSTTSTAPEQCATDGPLAVWLEAAADGLDSGSEPPAFVLSTLTEAGLGRVGVPKDQGGDGGHLVDAVSAIADVSARSLAAGFVLWGHRTYIEYLLQSPNVALRDRLLPDLLNGTVAGATGLSNAMKALEGLEELQFHARALGDGFVISGKLPWVTNLRTDAFHVAAAVSREDGPPFIASLSSGDAGLERSVDLDLIGLRSTSTAAIKVTDAVIGPDRVFHDDATVWLPQVRPAFLGLQCGMSIGLARRALQEARSAAGTGRNIINQPIADLSSALDQQERALFEGLRQNIFHANAAALFRIRIALADIVAEAVGLELQASGGRAYLNTSGAAFARRWREAAFIPVITPSLVQLKTALAKHPAVST